MTNECITDEAQCDAANSSWWHRCFTHGPAACAWCSSPGCCAHSRTRAAILTLLAAHSPLTLVMSGNMLACRAVRTAGAVAGAVDGVERPQAPLTVVSKGCQQRNKPPLSAAAAAAALLKCRTECGPCWSDTGHEMLQHIQLSRYGCSAWCCLYCTRHPW